MVLPVESLNYGVDLFMNMKLKESEKHFKQLADDQRENGESKKGGRQRFLLHLADVYVLRALLTEDKDDIDSAMSALSIVEESTKKDCLCNTKSKWLGGLMRAMTSGWHNDPTSKEEKLLSHWGVDNCIVLGHVYLWYACLLLRQGSYLKGAYRLRQAWKIYEKVGDDKAISILETSSSPTAEHKRPNNTVPSASFQDDDNQDKEEAQLIATTTYADLLFGMGAFHFFVSLVPPGFQNIAGLIGFSGEREKGREELQKCVELQGM